MILTSACTIPRRRFIKTFMVISASSCLFEKPWQATLLGQVQPSQSPQTAFLQVRISDYPALDQDFGSVRIGTSAIQSAGVGVGIPAHVSVMAPPGATTAGLAVSVGLTWTTLLTASR